MTRMTDPDELHAPPDSARKRAVLLQVAAYRELCRRVAKSGTHALFFGGFMLFVWYLQYGSAPLVKVLSLFSLLYLGTALLEFVAGLMNRFFPSAEGVLLEGVVLVVFGLSVIARHYLSPGPKPPAVFALFGVFWIVQGVRHVRGYAQLRRAFEERPTAAHVAWFEDLLREVREADPDTDPQALDLPARPRVRGKLLGDTAVFLVGGPDGLVVADRDAVEIDPEPTADPSRLPTAHLRVDGVAVGRFRLDPENWRNYAAWKAEGEAPPVVQPIRDR
jgi:ABC-type multidrug transport system fused ATPase/permease subunit